MRGARTAASKAVGAGDNDRARHAADALPGGMRPDGASRGVTAMTGEGRIVRRFRAMNTEIEIYARDAGQAGLLGRAEAYFRDFERRFGRFIAASEVCAFNARPSGSFAVSDEMAALLTRAIELHRVTGGIFEPAILPDLEAAGYDRSFERLAPAGEARRALPAPASIASVRIEGGRAFAPDGLRIDLGGIGKGWAVDAAIAILAPARDVLVNAGGDMYAAGRSEWEEGWYASVADPFAPERDLSVLWLRDAALATSTTAVRRWEQDGVPMHHLIDPRTRAPSRSGVASASVVAARTVDADVFAKTALILGRDDGIAFLDRQGTPGFLVLDDGSIAMTAGWPGRPPR